MQTFDAIIIGAGQAGPSLASRLTEAGMTVAFVERKLFGGTCVNTGCTPTKAMVASAYAAHTARRAAEYGVKLNGPVEIDMKAVIARREAIVAKSRNGVENSLRKNPRCTVFTGTASFESRHTVKVGDDRLEAKQIFLNVGGRATIPNFPGIHEVPFLTNTSLLALETLPKHLIIVGGSYISIEFGQMYRRFGSEVTIIEKASRLVQHEDEDVSAAVLDILQGEGIHVRLDAECISLAPHDEGVSVGVQCNSGEPASVGSHVLLAVGRTPNTQDLGLERAGVATDERGYVLVDDQLHTNVEGIYAMGDCNGKGAFTHTAYNDFEIVAANLLDNDPRRVSDRIPCYAMYMDPPLARIGMNETEVRKSGKRALIGTRPMTRVNRAVEKGESLGFMKVLVDAESKKILGASLLGVGCDEAIHCLLDTMYADAPYSTVQRAVHIHPTVSELIPTLLGSLKPLD
ncbi:FAD-containing oxidoreductase [Granulicella mallensis]|uniref:Pyruvate/2-oxoglutarate dehydrogenase complex dihydrolipoamide dehydrogenase (E3) component n=1 Tax=Granulicella mallensis TaxID=940614 RepID=A0A7W7ZW51_9BACT|nr:FAD-containing oxidoreductase [Granulicella mallensis]MBB5066356.1 pyruvate/2-oxoglutarate dehydrogenase complex dihydrolipoamide dehydrogenase (E3) component [Granulicella mallensis]